MLLMLKDKITNVIIVTSVLVLKILCMHIRKQFTIKLATTNEGNVDNSLAHREV